MRIVRLLLPALCVLAPGFPFIQSSAPAPAFVGTQVPGAFADASGHSAQSHLFYAANAGVWWVLTLSSFADSTGGSNHVIKAFHSSGPDLATATWIAAADSPGAAASASINCPNCSMGSGRALGVAYVNNAPVDAVHAEIAMAFDGQDGLTGHIRATVTATSIAWEAWRYHDEPAATWATPRAVVLGLSSDRFIHSGGLTLQQEVDANARVSIAADTGAAWSNGFSSVSVIDNSMLHQCNAMAFAPLGGSAMVAVYDNGVGTEPNMSNLRYTKSNADGSWPGVPVGTQLGGDGVVFGSDATIDHNDWTLVTSAPGVVDVFRSNAAGTAIDAATYSPATNKWSTAAAPAALPAGVALKKKAGIFGAASDSTVWLFAIAGDTANSILYTTRTGMGWTPWGTVPGTEIGAHARQFISGYPTAAAGQIGLIWTEGSAQFDLVATGLAIGPIDRNPPAVSLVEPIDQSTVTGGVPVSAQASDDTGVAAVQFRVDNVNQGPAQTAPYAIVWNSTSAPNGSHTIAAVASDAAGNSSAAAVTVLVDNPVATPPPPPDVTVDRVAFADGKGTRTTPAFSASAGDVLIAFVAADGPLNQAQSATVTGAGLTWTLVRRSAGQRGTSEIWRATASAPLVSVTVRSTLRSSASDQSLTVVAFANSRGAGVSGAASSSTGVPSIVLTTAAAGSLPYAVGNDGTRASGRTLGSNQVLVHQWIDTASSRTFWVQAAAAPIAAAGTPVALNVTSPTGDRWNLAAVELQRK